VVWAKFFALIVHSSDGTIPFCQALAVGIQIKASDRDFSGTLNKFGLSLFKD
jgi:hypothetical protein